MKYKENAAVFKDIIDHIDNCDIKVILEKDVNIKEYVNKLLHYAERFEAWQGNKLVGLVAAYLNDYQSKQAFITYVGVRKSSIGRGIASSLLEQVLSKAKELQFLKINLEVNSDNVPAIKLYEKFGFSATDTSLSKITMSKLL
ncbi:MAG: GNAT family N-acetyltransferase [Parcubacteria group bacterium]|jgi:ribosomal protein S18 acetylase RimI-like enzyme